MPTHVHELRRYWPPTHTHKSSPIDERPHATLAPTIFVDAHTIIWVPINFVGVNAMLWAPTKSLGTHVIEWAPKTQILGVQALWLGSHVNVWRFTNNMGAHLNRVDVQSDATLGTHLQFVDIQRNKAWMPKHVFKVTHFWASTDIQDGPPQHNSWTLTLWLGHPRIIVDGHTQSWAVTIYLGHPHANYAHPHRFVVVRGTWVDCHAFKWVPITMLWTSTKRAWLATENMWKVTHLVGRPR